MAKNITWHHGEVSRKRRAELLGHCGVTLWLTGLSGSGKSTIARALEAELARVGHHSYVLDGDNVRHGLNSDLGFSPEDRTENNRRVSEVARLFCDAGVITITAFISPYKRDRRAARDLHDEGDFVEVYVKADVATCESRDPKGLYKRARAGEIEQFTGISAPYEAPPSAEVVLDTGASTVENCVSQLMAYLEQSGRLSADVPAE